MNNQTEWFKWLKALVDELDVVTLNVTPFNAQERLMDLGELVLPGSDIAEALNAEHEALETILIEERDIKSLIATASDDHPVISIEYIVGGVCITVLDESALKAVKSSGSDMTSIMKHAKSFTLGNGDELL